MRLALLRSAAQKVLEGSTGLARQLMRRLRQAAARLGATWNRLWAARLAGLLRSLGPELVYGLVGLCFLAAVGILRPLPAGEASAAMGQPEIYVEAALPPAPPEEPPRNVLVFSPYVVAEGDTISGIATRFNLNQDSIITCNGIERARSLRVGTALRIPNMDGIMRPLAEKDSLEGLAETYKVSLEELLEVNNIEKIEDLSDGLVFIPKARMPSLELRRVWGELFSYPVRGWISSDFGWRNDPITSVRRFHNGIDIAKPFGSPVGAAMEGRVKDTGYNETAGNYVLLTHIGGYTSFYAHLSAVSVKAGQWLKEGQKLGEVGSTGYSTGSHLHFTVFRWGRPVNPRLLLY